MSALATLKAEDSLGAGSTTDRLIDGWMSLTSPVAGSKREAPMEELPIFGFGAVGSMLLTSALEIPERRFTLLFAGACMLGSICGCLQGAWSIGSIEAMGALVALGSLRKPR